MDLYYIIAITDHDRGEAMGSLYRASGLRLILSMPARGTAKSEHLAIYGLDATEKCVIGAVGSAQEVLALMQDFGISARLTFSNCLLRPEHLIDRPCNALCRAFSDSAGPQNGVIVHSELLLTYLKKHYPRLYFVSSTTKVLTRFSQLRQELERDDFSYVVPDFRLNRSFAQLQALPQTLKDKTEFLCNEGCWSGCMERRAC